MPSAVENDNKMASLVPTIDIAPYLNDPNSVAAEKVVDAVRKACTRTGFFQITGHGLPESVQQDVFKASKKLFDLDFHEKKKLDARTTVGRRGYDVLADETFDPENLPDLKEGFYVGPDVPMDDPKVKAGRFFMGPNVWPDEGLLPEQEFRAPVEKYFHYIHSLALRVLEVISRTLPYGPHIFDDFTMGGVIAVLRLLHYPPAAPEESLGGKKQFGVGAHTDFGAITLLLQDGNAGLEVFDRETQEYIEVEPTPGAYVFNVGDMLCHWTGEKYKSSWHRVINKAPVHRYSVAFFYDGALDCSLTPFHLKGSVEEKDPLTVEKHMIKRVQESYG